MKNNRGCVERYVLVPGFQKVKRFAGAKQISYIVLITRQKIKTTCPSVTCLIPRHSLQLLNLNIVRYTTGKSGISETQSYRTKRTYQGTTQYCPPYPYPATNPPMLVLFPRSDLPPGMISRYLPPHHSYRIYKRISIGRMRSNVLI